MQSVFGAQPASYPHRVSFCHCSAAERQRRRCESDKGLVGVACTHDRSQARDFLLFFVRAISDAEGSAILTQVSLSELGKRGTSDFLRILRLPTSMTFAEAEMCKPGTGLVTAALLSRQKRKRCHIRGGMLYRVPGGLTT